ncbi:MAG: glycosyltransferase family 4 protein [Candidatus Kerfeldbacteria bacterium]|nr:glycosyltransferase family 4 protein [Candidatus Kerfeldbacteria bacterium]
MRILFITRKYPPSIGGMETFSYGFSQALGADCTVLNVKAKPWAILQCFWMAKQYDVIHLGDGVLAGLGVLLKWWSRKPVTVTIHGLDVTYRRFGYQRYIRWCLPKLSAVCCVSQATATVTPVPSTVIPNGITIADWPVNSELGKNRCLLFVGRLVERKGCAWFLEQVLPKLDKAIHFHIVGTGPELERCQLLVERLKLKDRVRFHGIVSSANLAKHYCNAQALVMPNIAVPHNMEGLGMVALEAGACGLPVVAADLEGMKDVVIDGTTGLLVESGNVTAWIKAIQHSMDTMNQPFSASVIRQTVADRFDWHTVKQHYLDLFYGLSSNQ